MSKKPREQNKIDKAKIFDYFMKKHKIKEFEVFSRSYSKNIFGLDAIYHTKDFSYALCDYVIPLIGTVHWSGIGLRASDFVCKNEVPKQHNYKTFSFEDFPKSYKEAVIDHCIGTGISIIMSTAKILIPAAKSLEELAIKMELEA